MFWLCDFAGAPGADSTPFAAAAYNCPGDDDLEHVFGADQLVEEPDSTFRIVEDCLDRWTPESLVEELRRPEWEGEPASAGGGRRPHSAGSRRDGARCASVHPRAGTRG